MAYMAYVACRNMCNVLIYIFIFIYLFMHFLFTFFIYGHCIFLLSLSLLFLPLYFIFIILLLLLLSLLLIFIYFMFLFIYLFIIIFFQNVYFIYLGKKKKSFLKKNERIMFGKEWSPLETTWLPCAFQLAMPLLMHHLACIGIKPILFFLLLLGP